MGHLPETAKLIEFKAGERLRADALNWNFALAHGWVETAMARQGTPLAAHGELIRQVADLRKQVQALQARLDQTDGKTGGKTGGKPWEFPSSFPTSGQEGD